MIFHQQLKRSNLFIMVSALAIIAVALVWGFTRNGIATGDSVPVESHPYHQLAYTKLAYQGGNFTGDVYLLDVDSGDITQLTEGGESGTNQWLDRDNLFVYERPQGSVTHHYLLNVSRGTLTQTYAINPNFDVLAQSPDGQRLITAIINSETSATEGYAVIAVSSYWSQTLLNLRDVVYPPVWLPDSESIVYALNNGEICVHHVDNNTRDCINGQQPVLSPAITPVLLAYTTQVNDVHQLCIAGIENRVFSNIDCFDSNEAQFTGLIWRP